MNYLTVSVSTILSVLFVSSVGSQPLWGPEQANPSTSQPAQVSPSQNRDGSLWGNDGTQGLRNQERSVDPIPENNTQTRRNDLTTWNELVNAYKVGDFSNFVPGFQYISSDYDLPPEYRNGYVYINQGASVVRAFIFQSGLDNYPTPTLEGLEDIDFELAERYVREGKAIEFSYGLGQGTVLALEAEPWRSTQVTFSDDGSSCLNTTCLKAPLMGRQEIERILRSRIPISSQPQDQVVQDPSKSIPTNIPSFPIQNGEELGKEALEFLYSKCPDPSQVRYLSQELTSPDSNFSIYFDAQMTIGRGTRDNESVCFSTHSEQSTYVGGVFMRDELDRSVGKSLFAKAEWNNNVVLNPVSFSPDSNFLVTGALIGFGQGSEGVIHYHVFNLNNEYREVDLDICKGAQFGAFFKGFLSDTEAVFNCSNGGVSYPDIWWEIHNLTNGKMQSLQTEPQVDPVAYGQITKPFEIVDKPQDPWSVVHEANPLPLHKSNHSVHLSSDFIPSTEQIIHGFRSRCLDVRKDTLEDGSPLQLWDCNEVKSQRWHFQANLDGTVSIKGLAYKCLDLNTSTNEIILWPCHGGYNQKWIFKGGYIEESGPSDNPNTKEFAGRVYGGILRSVNPEGNPTNQCLTVSETSRGSKLIVSTCESIDPLHNSNLKQVFFFKNPYNKDPNYSTSLANNNYGVDSEPVIDGDGIQVNALANGNNTRGEVRFSCIDAPELTGTIHPAAETFPKNRACSASASPGECAQKRLNHFIFGLSKGRVDLEVTGKDPADRPIARVSSPSVGDINLAMVRDGWAVIYPRFLYDCSGDLAAYVNAQREARQEKRGIWASSKPRTTNIQDPECMLKSNYILGIFLSNDDACLGAHP